MWLNEDPPGQQGQGQCLSQGSLDISGGAGAGGHLVMETCGKEAGASSGHRLAQAEDPQGGHAPPFSCPTRPRRLLGLRFSAAPRGSFSTHTSIPDTSLHSPEDP